ncbi:glycosyltransferase family 2 protein [Marinihelvus fidelis]|uniref:Glycosyltransferase family 2 protein n=1 Tax=Marinihelvus fidelis TaxID=2613842 RepID=A0A5N0TJ83_9GAMM|nr:glycosyltransferase family 2 protein [Marinihelvus fidelis]KAA9133359.1 glycosyltransferase family 2 protein [Marinihelvus fidelis]
MIDVLKRILRLPLTLLNLARQPFKVPGYMVTRTLQAWRHGFSLERRQDHTANIRRGDILLFATLRNERVRMPWFLDYYRKLGVSHFLFVDNGSTDGFRELVADMEDVSVWYTEASYAKANFGMHWLNGLLRRYGRGHWCVTCDPDEFLVFPYSDHRNLEDLAGFLEAEQRRSFCCVMLDMYSDGPISDAHYREGDDPLAITPFFDGVGYVQQPGWLSEIKVQGGVRRRVFFNDNPDSSPSIHKTPFVKWRWYDNYFLSMHQLVPAYLNVPHAATHDSPTGVLLHFKYFSLLGDKIEEEMTRGEHWDNSFEYRSYDARFRQGPLQLYYERSVRYSDWQQLVSLGFMNTGRWF